MKVLETLSGLILEDGRRWGEVAVDWQWGDARAILLPGPGDPRLHFLTRPRGGSKTSDLAAFAIVALLEQLPPSSRAYWVAADRDQGRLGVDAMAGLIERSGLGSVLRADQFRVTAPRGVTLDVLAADGPGTMGLRSPLLIVDELAAWPTGANHRRVWSGLVSAVPKVPDCRLVCLTNAGDPTHMAAGVRDRALKSELWRVHEVPGPLPWVDPKMLADQREQLTDSEFARLHENRWTASEDRLVGLEDLRRAVRLPGPLPYVPGNYYRMGLDIGITNDRSVLTVCHAETDEVSRRRRVVLDRIVRWSGSRRNPVDLGDVERTTARLSAEYGGGGRAVVRADPFEAKFMIQRLRPMGVPVEPFQFTAERYAEIARTLVVLLRDGLLWLPDDEVLFNELATVRLRETGSTGLTRVDHDRGGHDDQVVSLGFSAVACLRGGWIHRRLTPDEREAKRRAERSGGYRSMSGDIAGRAF